VDVLFENIRDEDRMPSARFQPDPDTIRLVIAEAVLGEPVRFER
jgi:hypothetical protein